MLSTPHLTFIASRSICLAAPSWTDHIQVLVAANQQSAANRHRRRNHSAAHIIVIGQQFESFVAHFANEHDPVLANAIQLVARQHRRTIKLIAILRQVVPSKSRRRSSYSHTRFGLCRSASKPCRPQQPASEHRHSSRDRLVSQIRADFRNIAAATHANARQKLAPPIRHDRNPVAHHGRRNRPPVRRRVRIESATLPQAACRWPHRAPSDDRRPTSRSHPCHRSSRPAACE